MGMNSLTRMKTRKPEPLGGVIEQVEARRAAGQPLEAAKLYEAWIESDRSPSRCVALFNLGVLRSEMGDLDGAEAAYADAVAINPRLHQARINAGLVAERKHQPVEAVKHWLSVAQAAAQGQADAIPFATMALNHIGRLQESHRHYAAAESALVHSLQLDSAQPDAIQHWVHLRQKQCAWPVYQPLPGMTANQMLAATSPLAMLALSDDPATQWLTAHLFVSRKYATQTDLGCRFPAKMHSEPAFESETDTRGRLVRIGYLSGDLCTHAVGLLMADLLEAHDRSRVHVTAFDFSPEDGTAHRARLKRACDEMVSIRTMTDHEAASAIRDRGIDVLIDLHGLSSGARPGILALRPAPHIGGYLGFIGTTALPYVDFVVTDRWTLSESVTPFVTERPVYVDGSMIPLSHDPVGEPRFTREDVGLPSDAVVLACFNNIYKITPEQLASWLRILQRADRAVLWLLDDNQWATAALRGHVTAAGLDPKRLIFSARSTHAEYREKLTLADIYLDTYPYNAGSTARDVLDAGVPIVTLSGRTPVSRMAGGLLHAAGLDELIATSWDTYEALVVQLAEDSMGREALKTRMRELQSEWRSAPTRFVRSLEKELFLMVGDKAGRSSGAPAHPLNPASPKVRSFSRRPGR
jgi:predicted O-linked N-acetylglucosamine transferase (SPINDLY family)